MLKVLNTRQMQACDRAAIDDFGIPELVLMENAGVQVVEAIEEFFGEEGAVTFAICCGKGNNGGDGLVVARHLHNLGRDVRVYLFAEPDALEGPAATQLRMARSLGAAITSIPDADAWADADLDLEDVDCIVDALFGTGVQGGLRGHYGDVVDAINGSPAAVVAVDLPSGLSADGGEVDGPAVLADLTVTFATPKRCHVLPPAEHHCGELAVVDIGIPHATIDGIEDALQLLTAGDFLGSLPPRDPDTHKGSYGRVLIVAGSPGTTGAAVMTARAALRGGAGLVSVATPRLVWPIVGAQLLEALVHPVDGSESGGFSAQSLERLLELADSADVLAVGPGIGTEAGTADVVLQLLRSVRKPTVVDADGLNVLTGSVEALAESPAARVLTPHPGEMGRLLQRSTAEVQADRIGAARELAERSGATVVLKGYRSLIAEPGGEVAVNPSGNPGMASGGTGDVLTGLLAALLAQQLSTTQAARLATFAHGLAGDLAAAETGETALIAGDLLDRLAEALTVLLEIPED